jgi:Cytochrome C oxidase, cbb3-type, subunit III
VHPDAAIDALDDADTTVAFLKSYRPASFPGAIDPASARTGAAIYARQCAACHGDYRLEGRRARLVRFPNWVGAVGTDPLRATAFDQALVAAVGRSSYASRISVTLGPGYAAPPLTGLWASAPYLHNGSVPTLAALLSPATRLARFQVGGHALDFHKVGLRLTEHGNYPAGYRPFAQPVWLDARRPGRGNRGHPFGADLPNADKQALIAFLKLL